MCDVGDGPSVECEAEGVLLAIRERIGAVEERLGRERGVDDPQPLVHPPHGIGEFVGRGVLHDEAGGSGVERPTEIAGATEGGDDQAADARCLGGQLGGHGDPVEPRHLDVEEGDVDVVAADGVEHGVATIHLGHDLEVTLEVEQRRQRPPDERLVVGEQEADSQDVKGIHVLNVRNAVQREGQDSFVSQVLDPRSDWFKEHYKVSLKSWESDDDEEAEEEAPKVSEGLIGWLSELLGDDVKSVRASSRLKRSASVLVDDDFGMGANMERILRAAQQDVPSSQRILEINPDHGLVKALETLRDQGRDEAEVLGKLLLDKARLVEGEVVDAAGLVERIESLGQLAADARAR